MNVWECLCVSDLDPCPTITWAQTPGPEGPPSFEHDSGFPIHLSPLGPLHPPSLRILLTRPVSSSVLSRGPTLFVSGRPVGLLSSTVDLGTPILFPVAPTAPVNVPARLVRLRVSSPLVTSKNSSELNFCSSETTVHLSSYLVHPLLSPSERPSLNPLPLLPESSPLPLSTCLDSRRKFRPTVVLVVPDLYLPPPTVAVPVGVQHVDPCHEHSPSCDPDPVERTVGSG